MRTSKARAWLQQREQGGERVGELEADRQVGKAARLVLGGRVMEVPPELAIQAEGHQR